MVIRVRIQHQLAVGNIASDDGKFIFVICRRGLEQLLGERLKTGGEYLVKFHGETLMVISEDK